MKRFEASSEPAFLSGCHFNASLRNLHHGRNFLACCLVIDSSTKESTVRFAYFLRRSFEFDTEDLRGIRRSSAGCSCFCKGAVAYAHSNQSDRLMIELALQHFDRCSRYWHWRPCPVAMTESYRTDVSIASLDIDVLPQDVRRAISRRRCKKHQRCGSPYFATWLCSHCNSTCIF